MPALDVDDAQSADSERDAVREVKAAVVRSSVCHDVGHPPEPRLGEQRPWPAADLDDSADSAHRLTHLSD